MARFLTTGPAGTVVAHSARRSVRHHGLVFDTEGWQHEVRAQARIGVYEKHETLFVRQHLAGSERAIELGSSLGVTGSHLLSVMAPGGRLLAVEANPALVPLARRALAGHADGRAFEVRHAAVGDTDPVLIEITGRSWGSHVSTTGVPVRGTTLAALAEEVDGPFDLVSDIEGGEATFIFGAGLENCRRLVIELHAAERDGRAVSVEDMAGALERQGFRILDRRANTFAMAR